MNLNKLSCLVITLFASTFNAPSYAVTPPPKELANFCSQIRDSYIENTKKRYESQRYQGQGSAGVDISKLKLGGDGKYDWQRTWDNMDQTKKHEYSSSNCDEALKQWGQVSIAEIQADAQKALGKMKLEEHLYSEDTKRILGSLELDKARDTNATDLAKTKDTNATDLAKTKDTNATDLAKTKLQTNAGTLQTGIGAAAQVVTALINKPRQPKEPSQNVQAQPQQVAVAPTDPADALLRQWGWLKVSCTPGVVFIKGLNADTVCINPTSTMPAGEYIYSASTDQLQPVAVAPAPSIPEVEKSAATDDEEVEETNTEQEGGEGE